MKENIKEDIKNIEEIIELSKEEIDAKDENITAILDIEDLISLEHILSDYKRTLKKNEGLKEELETEQNERLLCYIRERQMIPVQKIKDKIEELKEKSGGNVFHIQQTINAEIRLLKELLEERVEEHDGK